MLIVVGLVIIVGIDIGIVLCVLENFKGVLGCFELVGKMLDGGLVFVDYVYKLDVFDNVFVVF